MEHPKKTKYTIVAPRLALEKVERLIIRSSSPHSPTYKAEFKRATASWCKSVFGAHLAEVSCMQPRVAPNGHLTAAPNGHLTAVVSFPPQATHLVDTAAPSSAINLPQPFNKAYVLWPDRLRCFKIRLKGTPAGLSTHQMTSILEEDGWQVIEGGRPVDLDTGLRRTEVMEFCIQAKQKGQEPPARYSCTTDREALFQLKIHRLS